MSTPSPPPSSQQQASPPRDHQYPAATGATGAYPSPSAREQQRERERNGQPQTNTPTPGGQNTANPPSSQRGNGAAQQQIQVPLSANVNHQETILQRVCEIFKTAFGRDEALCRREGRKYWLTRIIGHGATGVVLNAKAIATGQTFAVKIVEVASMSTSDKERAMAEVHSLLTCKFFSILKCHDDYVQYAVTATGNGENDVSSGSDPSAAAAAEVQGEERVGDRRRREQMLIVSSSSNPHPHLTNNLMNKEPMMLALVVDLANAGDLRQEIKNRARRGKP